MAVSLIGVVVVITAFVVTFVVLSIYQRTCAPRPETVRKLFHVCMGLVSLTLPLFFSNAWMVVALSATTMIALAAVRKMKSLKQQFGNVICGVKRRSYGEIYFSTGVALTFCFASSDWLAYSIAIFILTLADAAAAIVGSRFGNLKFKLIHDQKSIEGSVTFFTTAFLCAYLPLLVFGDAYWINTLLIAMIISLLLTAIEAAAWRGLDNLFIPLAALLLFRSYSKASLDELFVHLAVILLVAAVTISYMTITGRRVVGNA